MKLLQGLVMGALCAVAAGMAGCDARPEVSWHEHVSPMMQQHCTRCHAEGGQGLGDFTDLEQVRAFSDRIAARTAEGTMPPPAADPECRDYVGSEHLFLPADSKEMFERWIELGTPEGLEKHAPVVEGIAEALTEADLTLMMPADYTPRFEDARNPGNEYRCFVLDHGREDTFFVTGFHPVVGEPALVHHIVLSVMDAADVPGDYDPAVGVDCIDGHGGEVGQLDGMITGWAPGMEPVELDGSRGIRVGAHQRLVLQMHYYDAGTGGPALSDRSGYSLRTAPEVGTVLRMVPLGIFDFRIPAGDPAATASSTFTIPAGLSGLGDQRGLGHVHRGGAVLVPESDFLRIQRAGRTRSWRCDPLRVHVGQLHRQPAPHPGRAPRDPLWRAHRRGDVLRVLAHQHRRVRGVRA
jgi:hypothetical protein